MSSNSKYGSRKYSGEFELKKKDSRTVTKGRESSSSADEVKEEVKRSTHEMTHLQSTYTKKMTIVYICSLSVLSLQSRGALMRRMRRSEVNR